MIRALKFLGVFLGTLIIVLVVTFGFRWNALATLFKNRAAIQEGRKWVAKTGSLKGLTEYIGAQPKRVSLVSIAVGKPDSSLYYNAHTPRTMGRLQNLFLVIEYVRQVQAGILNPDAQIPIEKINQYQLPNIDQSNHQGMLGWLGSTGKISADNTVSLHTLVQASVKFGDVALADFLLFKLGIQNIKQLMDKLNLDETELPLPFSGLYITINPPAGRPAEVHFDRLSAMPRPKFEQLVIKKARRFVNDKQFRKRVLDHFHEGYGMSIQFMELRNALVFFPKTTAAEMAHLMKKLATNKLLSPQISKKVKAFLTWPLNVSKHLNNYLKTYGAIYDTRMGMAAGIDFGRSAFTGQLYAQAVFFDHLQVGFWFHLSSNMMHHDFQQRLIWDPALQAATAKAINDKTKQAMLGVPTNE